MVTEDDSILIKVLYAVKMANKGTAVFCAYSVEVFTKINIIILTLNYGKAELYSFGLKITDEITVGCIEAGIFKLKILRENNAGVFFL